MIRRSLLSAYFISALSIINLGFSLANIWLRVHSNIQEPLSRMTLLEDDYPIELPIHFDTVAMTLLRDTARFQMDLQNNISRLEWNTLSYHPFVVHLGRDQRAFQVALFHEIHCVHVMEQAFLRGEYHGLSSHHVQHCENYLRQSFLCMADDSVERGDFTFVGRGSMGMGTNTWDSEVGDRNVGSKVCRDWMGVSEAVMGNLKDWLKWNSSRAWAL